MLHLTQQNAKQVQLSGWVRQLQKQLNQFGGSIEAGDNAPSMEEQLLFIQQQYELLSLLYEVSLGLDNPDGVQKIVGVDVDLITREVAGQFVESDQ